MNKLKLPERISGCIDDDREQGKIRHSIRELVEQRILLMALGYEDCNDADFLRKDPLIKTVLSRLPESGKDLGSQPTLSRLENAVSAREIVRLQKLLLELYVQKVKKRGQKEVVLDIDTTDDETHGEQECSLFNGFYQETMYSELLVFDGDSGDLISAQLRPGNWHCSRDSFQAIRRIVLALKKECPDIKITVRGDSGFGVPEMMDFCELEGIGYIIGIKGNIRLKQKTKKLEKRAKARYGKSGRTVLLFGNYEYKAVNWKGKRRGFAKVECGAGGLSVRYVITNLKIRSPKKGYKYYGQRGQMENYIKDFKNEIKSGRLSCSLYLANYFRLMLTAFAYVVMQTIRETLVGTELEKAQTGTIRLKLFKVGAMVLESVRRVLINLSTNFPMRKIFLRCYARLTT